MRITILWSELSGYLAACLRTLVEEHQVSLQVFRIKRDQTDIYFHPYQDSLFEWLPELYTLSDGSKKNYGLLRDKIENFSPHILIVSGWRQPLYRQVAKERRQKGSYVIGTMDNQWHGTPKQWLGIYSAKYFLHPYYDALWVPGERCASFARRLGYSGRKLLHGVNACDYKLFQSIGQWRLSQSNEDVGWPRRFLFTGRFTKDKGLLDLLKAYQIYCQQADDPYELWLAGSGPLEHMIDNIPHVKWLGFLQPDVYAETLKQVGVFILPSHFEPWGVVVQEAISAALPILCSSQCGSSVELVHDGYNGFVFDAGDIDTLVDLMLYISSDSISLQQLGTRSFGLSTIYTPERWAEHLMNHLQIYQNSNDYEL